MMSWKNDQDAPVVLSISNRKGGTGKSTTAVNLATEFAQRGLRVLLIDLDSQGHAGLGFGIIAERGKPTAHRIFIDPAFPLSQAICPTIIKNLSLAPADQTFEHSGASTDLNILRNQLARPEIRAQFDLIILDTPPSLDFLLINALAAATGVVIPLIPHHLAREGVRQLIRLFFKIASNTNSTLELWGFLPVMVDQHIKLHRAVLDDTKRQFGATRLLSGIRVDIHLAEAFAAQQPIQLYSPKTRGALDYQLLALESTANA